jgi:hypothetical protein
MYVNNHSIPVPPKEVLDRCHQVLVGDPAFRLWQMKRWCREQNLSLIYSEIVETADVSAMFDEVAAFYFIDGKDATIFSLKFK